MSNSNYYGADEGSDVYKENDDNVIRVHPAEAEKIKQHELEEERKEREEHDKQRQIEKDKRTQRYEDGYANDDIDECSNCGELTSTEKYKDKKLCEDCYDDAEEEDDDKEYEEKEREDLRSTTSITQTYSDDDYDFSSSGIDIFSIISKIAMFIVMFTFPLIILFTIMPIMLNDISSTVNASDVSDDSAINNLTGLFEAQADLFAMVPLFVAMLIVVTLIIFRAFIFSGIGIV